MSRFAKNSIRAGSASAAGPAFRVGEPSLGEILGAALKGADVQPPIFDAGYGDLDALRALRDTALSEAEAQDDPAPKFAKLIEAVTFARLAATHDADRSDQMKVVGALDMAASVAQDLGSKALSVSLGGQALLLAEMMAEDGDDGVADHIAGVADQIPASAYREARRLRSLGHCPA